MLYLVSNDSVFNWRAFKKFSNISFTAYNKHLVYHSVIEKSVRFGANIKDMHQNSHCCFFNKALHMKELLHASYNKY